MGIELSIGWQGRSAADFARVFATAAKISNFRPALAEIGAKVVAPSVAANFAAGGRPKWAPLAQSTIERKGRAGVSDPTAILVHSGAMRDAASDSKRYKVTQNQLTAAPFGIPYWGYHQSGQGRVPQRIIMMLQAADRTKVNKIFADYIRSFMIMDPRKPGGRQFVGGGLSGAGN